MKTKQILAAILAAMMASAALSGCGDDGQSSAGESTAASSDGSSTAEVSDTFTGYPIETDQTLTVWSSNIGALNPSCTSYTDSPFHIGLEEKTGVKVDWQFPTAGTDFAQAFNLMLAGDTLPDIIAYTILNSGQQYIDDGVLRDLSGLMPEYSPAYWELLQSDSYYDKTVKTDSGQYFAYIGPRESAWGATYIGPVVRQDWLDEQGLSMPETIEDWDNMIRTFHEEYGAQFAFVISRMNPGFASAFGAFTTFNPISYVDDEGKLQYAMAQPEWRDYMAQLHEWYADGLIDPDSVTLDDSGLRSKVLNGKVGASCTAISQLSNWTFDAEQEGTGAQWVGTPYLPQTPGESICAIQMDDMASVHVGAITTSCPDEKLELAMRWLDYGYTDEGFLYWNYGNEGESYTMVDGVPTFTELLTEDPEGLNNVLSKYSGTTGVGFAVQADNMVRQKNAPVASEAVDLWIQNTEAKDHLIPVGVSLTTDESSELSAIENAINTYASEMALKFLTGEESLDNFDSFVETLNEMGLPRVLEIRQAAYDRFLAR